MEEVLKGILLDGISYGDNDKIINVFTLEKGVVSARIKGVKKAGAKLKFATEPFCFAEYVFSCTGDRRTVIGASLLDSFYPIRLSVEKLYSACSAVEFVKEFCKKEMVQPQLFFSLLTALKKLAYTDENALLPLTEFLILGLKEMGYGIKFNGCADCETDFDGRTFFDYESGSFYCYECANGRGREINNLTYKTLRSVAENEKLDGADYLKGLKLLDYYLTNKTEAVLKSLKQLLSL